MKDIEKVMAENVTPRERTSSDDCAKCVFYDFADVCRMVACHTENREFISWAANRYDKFGQPILDREVIDSIANESADRVLAASRAILTKHFDSGRGR